ncbi:MAG: IMPACT family protein [Methylophilaceae bacterium]
MLTVEKTGFAEQIITKSKFLAWAAQCQSEQEVGAFLRAIATQHNNASHLAYAFRVKTLDDQGNLMVVPRFSDAGEPSGTAGKPILQILEGRGLINVCVGVIRYYGGVNLGTGGLVRAYSGTARMALESASSIPFVEMQELSLTIQYNRMDELNRMVTQLKGKIIDKSFDDAVHLKISLPANEKHILMNKFS